MWIPPRRSTPAELKVILGAGAAIVVIIIAVALYFAWQATVAGNTETAIALRNLGFGSLGLLALVGGVFWLLMSCFRE